MAADVRELRRLLEGLRDWNTPLTEANLQAVSAGGLELLDRLDELEATARKAVEVWNRTGAPDGLFEALAALEAALKEE